MNKSFLVLFSLLAFFFCSSSASAQGSQLATDQVAGLLKRGDGSRLAIMLNSRVDLDLPGSIGIYSRKQAEEILKAFFKRYPPDDFILKHSGQSGEKATYSIGHYQSGAHQFRVYYLLKPDGDAFLIHQLRFEQQS
jgi:hypothetical protein